MKNRTLPLLAAVAALLVLAAAPAAAQVSLDPKDWYSEMKAGDDMYTVVKDMANDLKFYYLPTVVRLAEYTAADGKTVEPHFQLVKYQVQDPKDKEKLLQAAILQFAITLAPADAALAAMRADLAKKHNSRLKKLLDERKKADPQNAELQKETVVEVGEADVQLIGVPISKSRVTMFSDSGELVAVAGAQEGIGPTSTTAKVPFTVKLTDIGAKVFEAMFKKGNVGWPINVEYQYEGLTPRLGFKVTVDWAKCYDHYSKNTESVSRSCGFFWSRRKTTQESYTEVRDKLIETSAIKVELTADDKNFTMDQANKYLEPIIKRINEKLLSVEAPKEVEPAKADKPEAGGWWGSNTATSVAVKDVKKEKLGRETVDMNVQFYQTRTGFAAGTLSLGKYGDEKTIGEKYIVSVPYGNFEYARFSLPPVSEAAAVGITGVSILCKVTAPAGIDTPPQQEVSWNAKTGWGGRTIMMFPLMKLYEDAKKKFNDQYKSQLGYDVTYTITYRDGKQVLTLNKQYPMFDGEFAFQSPFGIVSYVNMASVDPDDLWNRKTNDPGIEKVEAKIKSDGKIVSTLLVNSKATALAPPSFLVDSGKSLDVDLLVKSNKALAKKDKEKYKELKKKDAAFDPQTVTRTYSYKGGEVPKDVFLEVTPEDWLEYYLLTYVYDEEEKKPAEGEMTEEQKTEMEEAFTAADPAAETETVEDDDWF